VYEATCVRCAGTKGGSPRSWRCIWPNEMTSCAASASSINRAHDLLLERNQSIEPNCPEPFADICLAQLRRFFHRNSERRVLPSPTTLVVLQHTGLSMTMLWRRMRIECRPHQRIRNSNARQVLVLHLHHAASCIIVNPSGRSYTMAYESLATSSRTSISISDRLKETSIYFPSSQRSWLR